MKEALDAASVDQKQPIFIRNALVAHTIAYIVDRKLGLGLNPNGRKLLKQLVVKACRGEKVSLSKEVPLVYQGANLTIEVDGQEHIPSSGPTIFIGNHTRGGPMDSMGQFFEMAKEGYNARLNVQDEEVREPFVIMQRGLEKGKLIRYFSGIFYEIAGRSLNCEIVAIPRYNKEGEIINGQNLKQNAIQRIVNGGASLWFPQGRHRDPDDLRFPEIKATGFLKRVSDEDQHIQLVPVRSIPDSQGNIKVIFGLAVSISEVVKKGGINYFTQNHIAPLR